MYGRNRQSIADLQESLNELFYNHPESFENEDGHPVLPGKCLLDVFDAYHRDFGIELMTREEQQQFIDLLDQQPDLQATPDLLLGFVAMRTSQSPETMSGDGARGRGDERTAGRQSRSSSANSNGTYYAGSRPPSRPPSRGSAVPPSPFDAQKRQRNAPLGSTAPSSWAKRPVAPARRKSVGEAESIAPSAFNRSTPGQHKRRPSGSQSSASTLISPDSSFEITPSLPVDGPYSRPHSRAQSQPQSSFSDMDRSYESDVPKRLDLSRSTYQALHDSISTLPMPRSAIDDDEDGEDDRGLIMERSAASSTISMDDAERLEVMRKATEELQKKYADLDRTMQRRIDEYETQVEELAQKLDEAQAELTAAKREEKELRSKERSFSHQISVLESEMQKIQKALEASRTSYSGLQRQYQEQLAESETLRNTLRRKEEELQESRTAYNLLELEQAKWAKEHDHYEERIAMLERDLEIAQETQATLDGQKHENLLLKETIDRLRFDIDELRNGQAHTAQPGGSSQPASISRSLGAEMSRTLGGRAELEESATIEDAETDEEVTEEITTKTRKIIKKVQLGLSPEVDVAVDCTDRGIQCDPSPFRSVSSVQTDPAPKLLVASVGSQTEEVSFSAVYVQAEEASKSLCDKEVQTVAVQSRSPSPQPDDEDAMASSSSTVLPPTPKAKTTGVLSPDLPPSYNTSSFAHISDPDARRELMAAAQAIKRYHKGLHLPMRPGSPLSAEAAAGWLALQQELGVNCAIIEKVIAGANLQPPKPDGPSRSGALPVVTSKWLQMLPQMLPLLMMTTATSALLVIGIQPLVWQYLHPGGPAYYDRVAWQTFNSLDLAGEGFAPVGEGRILGFLARLTGGAARVVRNWPT
ncbi:hypothetical protein K488DRAFT_44761 [Vararia minispora EC-137]|uniref:Uncharacterized protein n=1 Tax=Vararia minispora EC-137 TaxID=1314806 RepID=A0ACB8QSH5_9AGAM|nr:hypothetical protein K488DRAFT_44761 [Vararia minispora EC-137]